MTASVEYNSLLKIFATVLRKSGGIIELTAADIHDSEPPQGFTKRWDNDKKVLVIELIEHGTSLFLTNDGKVDNKQQEDKVWQPPSTQTPQSPLDMVAALQREQELLKQDRQQTGVDRHSPLRVREPLVEMPHRVLDDENQLKLERSRQATAAMKSILEYEPPQPATVTASRVVSSQSPSTPSSSQPQQRESNLPPSYFRT